MQNPIGAAIISLATVMPCYAQDDVPKSSITPEQREAVSDERAAEIKAVLRESRKRQAVVDAGYRALMVRWSMAVCIGCGPAPRNFRLLHTYPLRVLAGVPATEDDARERRGRVEL